MSRRKEALKALESADWSDAEVVDNSNAKIAQSVRFDPSTTYGLIAEAERQGTTVSEVIRGFVEDGLARVAGSATVKVADVERALRRLAQAA